MVTRKDVALKAGVSVATVSNVFNRKVYVLPDTERKVKQAAEELKYIPNFTARSLSLGHSYQIGVAVSECTNPYHMEIFEAISEYAADYGFMVTLLAISERFAGTLEFLRQRQFDAFVNFSNQVYPPELIEILEQKQTLLVNFAKDKGLNFNIELYDAVVKAMRCLKDLGHQKVGCISNMDSVRWNIDSRGAAFMKNRVEMGFCTDEDLIVYSDTNTLNSERVGYEGVKRLFSARDDVTALLVTNDLGALGAISALKEMGYRVPEDVSVIGCDGIYLGEYCSPRLSTISVDKVEYGHTIAERMVNCINSDEMPHGELYSINAQFIQRDSVAKARNR